MRLELRWSVVDEVVAGSATRLSGKRLEVDLDGLRSLLAGDARLAGIRLDLVRPGERCCIGRVFDVVARRAKLEGGEDFPGVLGGVARAGQGQTLALAGVAVVATDQQMDSVGTLAVIDMAGPNAALSAFGATHNLVISAWQVPGTERSDYLAAVRLAALKTAVCLARTAREAEPDRVEVFALPPTSRVPAEQAHLPRVAYVFQIHSHQRPTGLDEGILYGDPVRRMLPTIVHPNEVLDGAAGMLLFDFPGVDALVNVGSSQEPLTLPAMDRIVGADDLAAKLVGETRATYGTLCGAIELVGATRVMAEVR